MAYSFQNSTDRITLANTVLSSWSSAFSIVFWVNFDTVDTSARRLVVLDGASANRSIYIETDTGGTNRMTFGFMDTDGNWPTATWVSGFTAGTWHFVAGVWNGTTQRIYADTDATHKATNTPAAGPNASADTGEIGNGEGTTTPVNGYLAEVGIYTRALTSAELLAMGNGYSPSFFRNGLDNYYPLLRNANDYRKSVNGTVSGAVVVPHPRIIYPYGDPTGVKIPTPKEIKKYDR